APFSISSATVDNVAQMVTNILIKNRDPIQYLSGSGNSYNYADPSSISPGVTTLAGSIAGFVDETGAAAQFNQPSGVAVDSFGNVYVAGFSNNKIRKIT